MNILVTGGAGFIGSHLIRRIVDEPEVDCVVNLDALTYAGNLQNLEGIHDRHPRYAFEHADLRDAERVHQIVAAHDITHVLHLAAESHVDRSIQSSAIFMQTNVLGTLHLLDACRAYWRLGGDNRFIQVSTDEVYGSLDPDDPPFTEETPLLPNSPYSASKAAADCLVRSYVKTYDFPAIITRCCNNFGPGQHAEKLIPTVLRCLKTRQPIPVYGDGRQIREWIHVSDHVDMLWRALLGGKLGEVYNLGSGVELSNLQLIEHLCDLWDQQTGLEVRSSRQLVTHVQDRPGHDRRYSIDASKFEQAMGSPQGSCDPDDGLAALVASFLR